MSFWRRYPDEKVGKINAMVCGESRSGGGGKDYVKGHANTSRLYGLDHDRLKATGLEDFGRHGQDPSHLWRHWSSGQELNLTP